MTEQEIRDLLTEALESLFEIEPERIKPETNLNVKQATNCKRKIFVMSVP